MSTIATSHGIDIDVYEDALDPNYPNAFSRKYPYSITGSFWIGDEPTYSASKAILDEAKARGASVADDSESSQIFLNGSTVQDCVILTQVLKDQGRLPARSSEPVRTTIAVSVTVKLDAEGRTADDLISNAVLSADDIVTDALREYEENHGIRVSVEGATALVNKSVLERCFEGA